ncbi:MAG: hypothetical protein HY727_09605 [Candidatus Rokubacteria bacterium]|nr:hypothetical protein [Candidatus Rokubacteria bacterium]
MRRAGLASLLALLLAGCAIAKFSLGPEDAPLLPHYVLAHEDGWPASTEREALQPEAYEAHVDRILAGIDAHARRIWAESREGGKDPLRILVFVHGGLNGYAADFRRMRELVRGGPERPAIFPRTFYYPVFVNWNSALGDSLFDDLIFIRFGKRRPWWVGLPTAPFVLGARLAEGLFSTPNSWWANTRNFDELDPQPADWAESLALLPIRGLTTPFLKAFGTSAWQIMRRRADLLVTPRLGDNPANATEGAAQTLVRKLCARVTCGGSGEPVWRIPPRDGALESGPVEITFVGHSMGALVVNRLLASRHELPVRRIVYLAPAASIDEVEGLLAPYLKAHSGAPTGASELRVFVLSRKDEAGERDPSGLLPRGTLLVWIDNFFEPVTIPGHLRLGRYKAYGDYYRGAPPPYLRVHAMTSASATEPRTHGSFDDGPFFERILCTVDRDAFRDPQTCADKIYASGE